MIKKINIFLVLLLLLLSIGAVSAVDDVNAVGSDNAINDIVASDADECLSFDATNEELLTSNVHIVNSSTYYDYFTSKGQFKPTSIHDGDTLRLEGEFSAKDFSFSTPVTIVGADNNRIKNGVFTFSEGASGSVISNLNIKNNYDYFYGIFLNGVSDCTIQGCFINNTGQSSYGICVANNATNNNIINNVIIEYGQTYGHGTRSTPAILLSCAHHNYIANNNITCDDANAIYLSSFAGGPLWGGESNFNTIHNNIIRYNVLPTSWAYGIQVMGSNNTLSSNTIIGGYRGISTPGSGNVIIDNWIINSTGADYNNPGVPSGAESGIVGSYNSIIKNNHIVNARILSTSSGISALDGSVIENNYVEVLLQGKGIHPQGNNILIKNNTVITKSGSGILYNTYSHDLEVLNNNISSGSGIGVLIKKVSNSRMPSNITIVGNIISTTNKYAIDAAEADENSTWVIKDNIIPKGSKIKTPEGSFDPSKPIYVFNGTVYNITPDNIGEYIDDNGELSSDIKNGDILNFTGEFYDRVIYVTSAIKITGNNPIFYNTTFRVTCDRVWIENLVIRNSKAARLNAWGVIVYRVDGATVANCDIYVDDPNAAYAIYVVEASDVDVINNTLFSSGNYLTYTLLAYETEDCNFVNNTIFTLGTGEVYKFESEHCIDGNTNCLDGDTNCLDGDTNCLDGDTNCLDGNTVGTDGNHVLSEVYRTYGILMAYSSGNNVTGNKVNVTTKLNRTVSPYNSTNSVVGIDSYYNTHDNLFADNEVYIKANDNYIYGMGVLGYYTGHDAPEGQGATNNQFINNYIVMEGTYCIEGIIVGDSSEDTIVKDNIIKVKSDNVAYGITLEMSQKSTLLNNYIEINSEVIYGIEAYSSSNNILDKNTLDLNGKQVYGAIFLNANYNSITNNEIFANGTGEDIDFHNFDSLGYGNGGIYLKSVSTNNEIKNNKITSAKNYAVLADVKATENVISNNYLDSEKGIGDDAVNNTINNVVENNYRYTFGKGSLDKVLNIMYLGTAKLNLRNIVDGALVNFYITDFRGNILDYAGSTISSNGVATLNYKLDDSLIPKGVYKVKAIATKEYYQTMEVTATLTVAEGKFSVVLNNVSAKRLTSAEFVATVVDSSGDPISGVNVRFYRDGNVVIGETATVDGIAKALIEISTISYGEHDISAKVERIDGKINIYSGIGTATLNINNKTNFNVVLNDAFADPNTDATFTATVKNESKAVSGLNIKFYVRQNGADVLVGQSTTGSNGVAKLKYTVPSTFDGIYFITAKLDGTADYNSAVDQAILKTKKNSATLAVDNVSTYIDSETTFTAAVKDAQNRPVLDANVKFYIIQNGENIFIGEATTGMEGIAELITIIPPISAGEYVFSASLESDGYYPVSKQAALNIEKCNSIFDVEDVSVVYKGDGELVATLIDGVSGKAIGGVSVVAKIGGTDYSSKTDSQGQVKFSTNGLIPGEYTADVSYGGNSKYNPASATAKITVNKSPTRIYVDDISVDGRNVELSTTLINEAIVKGLSNVNIKFGVGNQKYTVKTNSDGEAKLSISGLALGHYTANISYGGNSYYTPSNASVNFTIKANVDIYAVYDADNNEIIATLTNEATGKAVSGVNVQFDIGGLKSTVKTDSKGQAKLSTADLAPGTYTATVTYKGSSSYNPASTSVDFSIKNNLVISAVYDLDNNEIIATLTREATGKAVSGANVQFDIGGVKSTVKTDSKGQAKLSTADLASGTYTATISYKGNSNYNPASTTLEFIIGEMNAYLVIEDVFVDYGDDINLSATLINKATGKGIANAKVIFVVNNQQYTVKTNSKGDAKLTISDLNPGNYACTVSYDGGEYNPCSETFNIVVNKITTSISLYYDKSTKELVATLINTQTGKGITGGNVVFKLNGVKYTVKSKLGEARLSIGDADPNTFNATASYGGNFKYLRSAATIRNVEGKIPTNISHTYNKESDEIIATLTNVETGNPIKGANVVINLAGMKKVTVKTDKQGQAKVSIADLNPGILTITCSYGGNSKYSKSLATITIAKP